MRHEASFGIIPMRLADDSSQDSSPQSWEILVIRHKHGQHYGFPKGHPNAGETPEETAKRELFEETGLALEHFLPGMTFHEEYTFYWKGEKIHKRVSYFVAQVTGVIKTQDEEISEAVWLSLADAERLLTYPQARNMCAAIAAQLQPNT
jgi:bis(5'-nucleosidyl)-tetraphosphatase